MADNMEKHNGNKNTVATEIIQILKQAYRKFTIFHKKHEYIGNILIIAGVLAAIMLILEIADLISLIPDPTFHMIITIIGIIAAIWLLKKREFFWACLALSPLIYYRYITIPYIPPPSLKFIVIVGIGITIWGIVIITSSINNALKNQERIISILLKNQEHLVNKLERIGDSIKHLNDSIDESLDL